MGLILTKSSLLRISIPLDLSSRSFIPLPCFVRSRRPTPLLAPSLVLFPPFFFLEVRVKIRKKSSENDEEDRKRHRYLGDCSAVDGAYACVQRE